MAETKNDQPSADDLKEVSFELHKPHTHRGIFYDPAELKKAPVITLRKNQAQRLQDQEVGKIVNG